MIFLSHKNGNRGKNRELTDFSDLLIKTEDSKEKNVDVDSIKTAEGDYEIMVCKKNPNK